MGNLFTKKKKNNLIDINNFKKLETDYNELKNFANISLRKSFLLVFFGWVSSQIIFGKFY